MQFMNYFRTHVIVHICIIFICLLKCVHSEFTHEWAVQIDGGEDLAKEIAHRNNFEYLGKIFDDVFHFRHKRLSKRSALPAVDYHRSLSEHPQVRWAEQQIVKKRVKRDFDPVYKSPPNRRNTKETHFRLSDPKWPAMWYLNRGGSLDMNVERAWKSGVTGKGVVVTILDDGLEKDHPDLVQNYDPNASYDVNGQDPDPEPRYDLLDSNRHGTRCAGEVAADANNSICAVGVAYEASVGGVRMLDGDVTDAVEARSLALNPQHIDIYSASWGPDDDGKTVDGPGQLATRAFIEGIKRGRKGKGSIFVWASGNGGRDDDNCNCDGYTNAIWTLSISSATEKGRVPWYSEACSSTLASTYSSGALGERQIVTTDLHHSCTMAHTGTSASAPLAAGICALALHANNDLTWRDLQHVVVRTARPENLDGPDWQTNGVGRKVSHRFGYGLMDAYGMVELAKNWTTVPPQRSCEVPSPHIDKMIPQKSFVTLTLEVSDCPGVNYLEHVQSKVTLFADRRGDIEIFLISPAGTKSNLLAQRPRDNSRTGFHSWPFMTVHMWGESPLGIWKLEIHNNGVFFSHTGKATVKEWNLLFYGTEVEPGKTSGSLTTLTGNTIDDSHESTHSAHSNGKGGTEEREKDSSSSTREQETRNPQQNLDVANSPSSKHESASGGGRGRSPQPLAPPIGISLPPMGCLTLDSAGSNCIECSPGYIKYESTCVDSCPKNMFVSNSSEVRVCSSCHYSCETCRGPYDYECLTCRDDATLTKPYEIESFCYPTSLLSQYSHQASWLFISAILFLILLVVNLVLVFCCFNKSRSSQSSHHSESGNGGPKISNGLNLMNKKNYSPVNIQDSDQLMTKIPFHDSTSDEEL